MKHNAITTLELKAAITTVLLGTEATPKVRHEFFRVVKKMHKENRGQFGEGFPLLLELCDVYEDSLDGTEFSTLPVVDIDIVSSEVTAPRRALRRNPKTGAWEDVLPDVEIDPVTVVPKQSLRLDNRGRIRLVKPKASVTDVCLDQPTRKQVKRLKKPAEEGWYTTDAGVNVPLCGWMEYDRRVAALRAAGVKVRPVPLAKRMRSGLTTTTRQERVKVAMKALVRVTPKRVVGENWHPANRPMGLSPRGLGDLT